MDDPLTVHRHDQVAAALRETAFTLASFYFALQEEGFTRDEAWALVVDFHARMLDGPDDDW